MRRLIIRHLKALGVQGALKELFHHIKGSPCEIKVQRKDCRHPFWLRGSTSDIPTSNSIFVEQEYAFSTSGAPQVIIDAGANIGLAAIYFANRYPDCRIIAIEPEESNFALLQKNTAAYPNISILQAALWNRNETIDLVDPGLGKWGFMTESRSDTSQPHKAPSRHTVPALTVDQIMQDFGLSQIDILKIDIEGGEKEVFEDTRAWIDQVGAIVIELHDRMKAGCSRSFYTGTPGFAQEWRLGENLYLSKGNIQPMV